ncbi:hypothetical protein [Enterococcus avium]|nr:hypothetical protein [Enterococcus avium]
MGKRKMKLSAESRVMFVEKYLNKESGLNQVAKEAGVAIGTIKNWCTIYENE